MSSLTAKKYFVGLYCVSISERSDQRLAAAKFIFSRPGMLFWIPDVTGNARAVTRLFPLRLVTRLGSECVRFFTDTRFFGVCLFGE